MRASVPLLLVLGSICCFGAQGSVHLEEPQHKVDLKNASSSSGGVTWLQGAPLMRTTIKPLGGATSATLRMSGLGWSYAKINGVRVDPTRQLDPGWTYYRKNALVSTFDITSFLKKEGDDANTAAAAGGGGGGGKKKMMAGDHSSSSSSSSSSLLEVHLGGGHFASDWDQGSRETILYAEVLFDGHTVVRSTQDVASWQCSREGPVLEATLYGGEVYDARREEYVKSDSAWVPCLEATDAILKTWDPKTSAGLYKLPEALVDQNFPPIREHEHFPPVRQWNMTTQSMTQKSFFDFGQNFAGVLKLQLQNCAMGTTLILQHAELLWPNQTLNRLNLRLANATDVYICKGANSGREVFQPYFTYHGFQFASIEVMNSNKAPDQGLEIIAAVHAVVLHNAVEQIGFFNTTHPVLQGIHHMAIWSQRSNLMSIPTDCSQRDERLGWMADAHLSSEEANLNFDMLDFYLSHTNNNMAVSLHPVSISNKTLYQAPNIVPSMLDAEPMPSVVHDWGYPGDPAWISAFSIIPLATYRATGNTTILADNFDLFEKYAEYQATLTSATTGLCNQGGFGDWNAISKVGWTQVGTSYLFGMQRDLAEISAILNKSSSTIAKWKAAANKTKNDYNAALFDSENCTYKTVLGYQSANAIPLYAGLVPEGKESCVADTLASYVIKGDVCASGNGSRCYPGHLSVGIIGAQALLPALSNNGHHDLAYKIATTETFPSWGYWLTKNATTLWEKWSDYINPDGNDSSHNHVMFGSIDVWLYRHYAGLSDQHKKIADCRNVCALGGHTVEASVRDFSVKHEPIGDSYQRKSSGDVVYLSTIVGGRSVKTAKGAVLTEVDKHTTIVRTHCGKTV